MKLKEFNSLCLDKRLEILQDRGTYLDLFLKRNNYKTALYSIYNFYAEVWLNEINNNVDGVLGFNHVRHLNPYLKLINIKELLSAEGF